MRYEIRVDHIARICVWRTRQHYGVMHEALAIPAAVRHRIDAWIDRYAELRRQPPEDDVAHAAWLDYDGEGRRIARQLKSVLGPDAEVFYYCEATDEYEPVTDSGFRIGSATSGGPDG
jgi:hypothetical protein